MGFLREYFKNFAAPAVEIEPVISRQAESKIFLAGSFKEKQEDANEANTANLMDCNGQSFAIAYGAGSRGNSHRRVTATRIVDYKNNLYLFAYCHEARARRSFRADMIEEIIDLQTGEIIESATDFFSHYYAIEKRTKWTTRKSPTPLQQAINRCGPYVQIMIYMAISDGEFHPDEREVIKEYINESCIDLDFSRAEAQTYFNQLMPDSDSFLQAASNIMKPSAHNTKATRKLFNWYLKMLIDVDGEVAPQEFDLFKELSHLTEGKFS